MSITANDIKEIANGVVVKFFADEIGLMGEHNMRMRSGKGVLKYDDKKKRQALTESLERITTQKRTELFGDRANYNEDGVFIRGLAKTNILWELSDEDIKRVEYYLDTFLNNVKCVIQERGHRKTKEEFIEKYIDLQPKLPDTVQQTKSGETEEIADGVVAEFFANEIGLMGEHNMRMHTDEGVLKYDDPKKRKELTESLKRITTKERTKLFEDRANYNKDGIFVRGLAKTNLLWEMSYNDIERLEYYLDTFLNNVRCVIKEKGDGQTKEGFITEHIDLQPKLPDTVQQPKFRGKGPSKLGGKSVL